MPLPDTDRVCFLLKDPHWTFIWWKITRATVEKVKLQSGETMAGAKFALRIYDVTDICFDGENAHCYFDIDVIGETDHWYQYISVSNRTYCVEAGLIGNSGRFRVLARSNRLAMPRDSPSGSEEEKWGTIELS